MGLLRTMAVLRVDPQHPAHLPAERLSATLAGAWNKRIRHLSSPVVYLTALLA